MDVHTFCERSVDVMGEESDHIHAQALTDAVQVSAHQPSIQSLHRPFRRHSACAAVPMHVGMHLCVCIGCSSDILPVALGPWESATGWCQCQCQCQWLVSPEEAFTGM
jgi:hypothetical protein